MRRSAKCLALVGGLTVLGVLPARADIIVDQRTYAGCFTDLNVSTCFTVAYVLELDPITSTIRTALGGPIVYSSLNTTPGTQWLPIYQSFAPSFFAFPDEGHIDLGVFEPTHTHNTSLPDAFAIRFAEVRNCPNTGVFAIPVCGAIGDPAFSLLNNEFVKDISVAVVATPEPTTLALVAVPTLILLGAGRFRRNSTSIRRRR